MEVKTILITGGDGFTGQHASDYFAKKGYDVYTTSRKYETKKIYKIDLLNKREVFEMIKQIQPDYVLHLAGQNDVQTSWAEPLLTFETNAMITLYLLEAVRTYCPNAKVLVVGSILEESSHPYGFSKWIQHVIAKKWAEFFQLNVVMANPVNLIGPGFSNGVCAKFAKKIVMAELTSNSCQFNISNLKIKRDFLDVRDAVRGYELLLQKGENGKAYDVGTGKLITLADIVQAYKNLTTITIALVNENKPLQETKLFANPLPLQSLGWQQKYTLTNSLRDCLHFFRKIKLDGEGTVG